MVVKSEFIKAAKEKKKVVSFLGRGEFGWGKIGGG